MSEVNERSIAKSVAAVTGVRSHIAQHMMYMIYLERLHKIAVDSLNCSTKLHEFELEIPYIGVLHFKSDNESISVDGVDLKPEFISDALSAINKGESKLLNSLNAKFIETLNNTYRELI